MCNVVEAFPAHLVRGADDDMTVSQHTCRCEMALWRYGPNGPLCVMALWRYGPAGPSALWRYGATLLWAHDAVRGRELSSDVRMITAAVRDCSGA